MSNNTEKHKVWDCHHCGTKELSVHEKCHICSAEKNIYSNEYFVDKASKFEGKQPSLNFGPQNIDFFEQPTASKVVENKSTNKHLTKKRLINFTIYSSLTIFVVGIIYLVYLLGVFIFAKNEQNIFLTEQSWTYSIRVQEFRQVKDDDWCSDMPSDSYNIHSRQEIRSHREVYDGKTCSITKKLNADGTSSLVETCEDKYRKEPIYDSYCSYTINRWRLMEVLTSTGHDKNPEWPSVNHLQFDNTKVLGNLREDGRHQEYLSIFTTSNENEKTDYKCYQKEHEWHNFNQGSEYKGLVSRIGGLSCDSIIEKYDVRKDN